MPYFLGSGFDAHQPHLPAITRWDAGRGRIDDWDLVIDGSEIYRPVQEIEYPVLHTVVTCDLSRPQLRCDAQGIVGPYGRSFHVSQSAVYV